MAILKTDKKVYLRRSWLSSTPVIFGFLIFLTVLMVLVARFILTHVAN